MKLSPRAKRDGAFNSQNKILHEFNPTSWSAPAKGCCWDLDFIVSSVIDTRVNRLPIYGVTSVLHRSKIGSNIFVGKTTSRALLVIDFAFALMCGTASQSRHKFVLRDDGM